jgi:enoyl-CoA hydratase
MADWSNRQDRPAHDHRRDQQADVTVGNDSDALLHDVAGRVGIAVLNRPAVLNVIDMDLIKALTRRLEIWRKDPAIAAVFVRGTGKRAFCAGGDVRAVYAHRGDDAFMDEVYRVEYLLDDAIARYPKPYVVLMSGIVMGGGCGISIHGSHRIVTETTLLAMPECRIGLFPDIGASFFLARCPGRLGLYLGLTGARVGAADALYLGLADYFIPTNRLSQIISAINDVQTASDALGALAIVRETAPLSVLKKDIDAVFALTSVRDIVAALASSPATWAREAYASMNKACPLSLELTFRSIQEAETKTLRECLISDFRIAQRLMKRNDYFEGVRARIIDKDDKARWTHDGVAAVNPAEIEACFSPLGDLELRFEEHRAHLASDMHGTDGSPALSLRGDGGA